MASKFMKKLWRGLRAGIDTTSYVVTGGTFSTAYLRGDQADNPDLYPPGSIPQTPASPDGFIGTADQPLSSSHLMLAGLAMGAFMLQRNQTGGRKSYQTGGRKSYRSGRRSYRSQRSTRRKR